MPLNKPAFRSKLSDHCRRKGFILAYFSAFSLLVFLAFVIFRSTFERIIKIQEGEIGEPKANIADYKQALINSEKLVYPQKLNMLIPILKSMMSGARQEITSIFPITKSSRNLING